ncbi:MAG: hypothetical protein H0X38_13265, partial [Planctomycetes bacterium]|nr:hypothetical protein [Planctomycetota bacterium]
LKALEEAKQAPAATPAPATGSGGLTFGAYGEMKFGARQNPDDGGAWQNGFDGGHLTLLPSYQVGERLLFKAEIEIEHGGTAVDDDDKLAGALEVEQCYLDYTVDEHFHWRLPGIDVVPFGYTNLNHEPTLFYSVQRPELANGLIPTTWFGAATSIHGVLAGPVSYQFQISSSLIDDGGNVRDTSAANGPASPGGYPAGISGSADALGLARPTTDEFKQQSNQLGYTLRLAYSVPPVTGLAGSSSVYFTPDVVPRHAYASDLAGVPLGDLHHCALTMADTELRFRPAHDGLELRAEAVAVWFSSPANLRANNDGDPGNNVGSTMWGVSAEVAWHQRFSESGWEFVPFYRYSRESLQNTGVAGLDADAPTGSGRIQFHTLGVAMFPAPEVVIKLDYQAVLDGSASGPHGNHVLGGVGFFF